jgi:Zn-dependent protease/CBS domain-containing protein
MNESVRLGRIAGIRVGLNWSLLPIFVLLAWSLARTLLPSAAPGYSTAGYWVFALLTTAAFYASLLAHELAHALVARRYGIQVKSIVLWVLGGVAQLQGESPHPRAELEVAAAGPAVSFGLAAAGAVVAWLLGLLGVSSLLVAAIGWLAGINVLLGLFNLLPAFPLDGGRILRAALWHRWHDRARATTIAAKVGRIAGFALIGVGALEFLAGGGTLNGIWLALIGWFVAVAAEQQAQLSTGVGSAAAVKPTAAAEPTGAAVKPTAPSGELTVADAMTCDPLVVPLGSTAADVIERYVLPTRFSAFPIVDGDGRLIGLATVRRIAALPRESWATTLISTAAAPRSVVVECSPDDRLTDVAARLECSPDRRAIVLDGARVVGILTAADIAGAAEGGGSHGASLSTGRHAGRRRPRTRSVWGSASQL